MAKKAARQAEPRNLPAKTGGLPAVVARRAAKDAGRGVSTAQEDNLVPLIYILQKGSPQVNSRAPEYMEGSKAGTIWLRNFADPLVDGEEGILFQPCYFSKDWVEWKPNRGGFVGRHDGCPADARQVEDPQVDGKFKWIRKNKNEVVETRYHTGIVWAKNGQKVPYVIPMSGSGHTASRQWMFMMNSKQLPDGGKAPSWVCLYRLRTKYRENAQGDWFMWEIADAGWIENEEDYNAGITIFEAFEKGEKRMDDEVAVSGEGGGIDKM